MGIGGGSRRWKIEEDIFLAALRLGTTLPWVVIHEAFLEEFPDRSPNRRDLESRINKSLKINPSRPPPKRKVTDMIDDYRHYGRVTYPKEQEVINKAFEILNRYDDSVRLWW